MIGILILLTGANVALIGILYRLDEIISILKERLPKSESLRGRGEG